MSRRHFTFDCEGDQLVGSLDPAAGRTGLLIVTGGNETRSGAWNGQALIAARAALAGVPVMRFDRRGVGDSEGENLGFTQSQADIRAAAQAFSTHSPQIDRIVAWGNCDAASALMLGEGCCCDALVLSNPWTLESREEDDGDDDTPAEVLRDHYRRRLADPAAIKRLLTGKVSIGQLGKSLNAAFKRTSPPADGLAARMAQGLGAFQGNVRILIAERDRTAQAFLTYWDKNAPRIYRCPDATHSFVEPAAQEWLYAQIMAVVRG